MISSNPCIIPAAMNPPLGMLGVRGCEVAKKGGCETGEKSLRGYDCVQLGTTEIYRTTPKLSKIVTSLRGAGGQSRSAEQSGVVFGTSLRDALRASHFGKSGSETYLEEGQQAQLAMAKADGVNLLLPRPLLRPETLAMPAMSYKSGRETDRSHQTVQTKSTFHLLGGRREGQCGGGGCSRSASVPPTSLAGGGRWACGTPI